MNPLSPLTQQSRGKSNVRLAVISIIALHAVFFGGLLLQGCKPRTTDTQLAGGSGPAAAITNDLAPFTPTNASPFTPDATAQPGFASQPLDQSAQTSTPGVVTNWGQAQSAWPPVDMQPPAPPAGTTEYAVKSGDIPARIAKDHGITLSALLQANPGLEPTKLKIGQKLQIPPPAAAAAAAAGVDSSAEKTLTYVVKAGDNLTKIAKLHGLTVKELRAANNLKTDRINVGQKLKIPGTQPAAADTAAAVGGTGSLQ